MEIKVNLQLKVDQSWFQGNKLMVRGMDELFIYLLTYLLYHLFAHLSIGGMSCSCN